MKEKAFFGVIAVVVINLLLSQKLGVDPWSWAGLKMLVGTVVSILLFIIMTWSPFNMNFPKKIALSFMLVGIYWSWFPVMNEWTTAAMAAVHDGSNALGSMPPPTLPWYAHEAWRFVATTIPGAMGWAIGGWFD